MNLITFSGKGGVGKTTTTALLIDELARFGYEGRLLVVDGDPATTLYLALGQAPPAQTLADVRDKLHFDAKTVRGLPGGQSPAQFVARQLQEQQVLSHQQLREMTFDMLALGWGEGRPGCYCSLNHALSQVLSHLLAQYDLVIIDNEAGLEHLSRYRVQQVKLFVTVVTDHMASQIVGGRIRQVAASVGMQLQESVTVQIGSQVMVGEKNIAVPLDPALGHLLAEGQAVDKVSVRNPCRYALRPLVVRALALGGYPPALVEAARAGQHRAVAVAGV